MGEKSRPFWVTIAHGSAGAQWTGVWLVSGVLINNTRVLPFCGRPEGDEPWSGCGVLSGLLGRHGERVTNTSFLLSGRYGLAGRQSTNVGSLQVLV